MNCPLKRNGYAACRKMRKEKTLAHQGFQTFIILERVMGIEPTLLAWKAKVLPLNYTRMCDGRDDTI